jgi:hypothetical protein
MVAPGDFGSAGDDFEMGDIIHSVAVKEPSEAPAQGSSAPYDSGNVLGSGSNASAMSGDIPEAGKPQRESPGTDSLHPQTEQFPGEVLPNDDVSDNLSTPSAEPPILQDNLVESNPEDPASLVSVCFL